MRTKSKEGREDRLPKTKPAWANNLESIAKRWGFTYENMAEVLFGDSSRPHTAGKWARGDGEPSVDAIIRLSYATGISIPALWAREIPANLFPPQPMKMNTPTLIFPAVGEPDFSELFTPQEEKSRRQELADLRAEIDRIRVEKTDDLAAFQRLVVALETRVERLEAGGEKGKG